MKGRCLVTISGTRFIEEMDIFFYLMVGMSPVWGLSFIYCHVICKIAKKSINREQRVPINLWVDYLQGFICWDKQLNWNRRKQSLKFMLCVFSRDFFWLLTQKKHYFKNNILIRIHLKKSHAGHECDRPNGIGVGRLWHGQVSVPVQ